MINILAEADELILKLSEEQLRLINRKIVERLKLIHRAKSSVSLARFNLSDRVYFIYEDRKMLGTITKLNQKSASIKLDDGRQWLVAPGLLTKVIDW